MNTTTTAVTNKEKLCRQKEKALNQWSQDLLRRERLVALVEQYVREREADLKKHLVEHGLSIVKDEDAVFFMD